MLSNEEMADAIERQQPRGAVYPLEVFCRSCGTGNLALPSWQRGSCRKCERPLADAAYRKHPAP